MPSDYKVGDRVVVNGDDVGHVERLDGDWVDVRLLTPKNEPSCCVTTTRLSQLSDGTNVVPQPRNEAWWRQARAFQAQVSGALDEMFLRSEN